MDVVCSREQLSSTARSEEPEDLIFRKYYTDNDYFLSPEGLLKVLSIIVCIVSSIVCLCAASCAAAPGLAASAATVALVCGATTALIYGGVLLDVPLYAPQAYLFGDVIISTVLGVLLLIMAGFRMTVCPFDSVISYIHGPLVMVNAVMIMASAVVTYVAVMRLWDATRLAVEPPPPTEQDV